MISEGADPLQVKEAMGHTSIDITFDVYGHLFPKDRDHRRSIVDGLAENLVSEDTNHNQIAE